MLSLLFVVTQCLCSLWHNVCVRCDTMSVFVVTQCLCSLSHNVCVRCHTMSVFVVTQCLCSLSHNVCVRCHTMSVFVVTQCMCSLSHNVCVRCHTMSVFVVTQCLCSLSHNVCLLSHKASVTGDSHTFNAMDSDPGMSDRISVLCPVKSRLELKEGAQVPTLHWSLTGQNTGILLVWLHHCQSWCKTLFQLPIGGHYNVSFSACQVFSARVFIFSYIKSILILHFTTIQSLTWHPSISTRTNHWFSWIASPIKMMPVSICRKPPTVICHHLTVLMPRCTNTSFLLTPQYIHPPRNSNNLHNAISIGNSFIGQTNPLMWSYVSCDS